MTPPKKKIAKRTPKGGRSSTLTEGVSQRLSISDLLLDSQNPRLAEYGVPTSANQLTLVKSLWTKMAVEELALSIAHNGFFPHEPLLVEAKGKKFVVLEGNRRLAAVKLLLDEDLRAKAKATNLPKIDEIDLGRREALQTIPCVVTNRKKVWRYLGFKHVNGPATWGAYAKAKYISLVHHEYGVSLEAIATQIGDINSTVERMYNGLMVIEQAENEGVFQRENSMNRFAFSHIYTGLDKPGIQEFLGLKGKARGRRRPVPKGKIPNLKNLLLWMYGDKDQECNAVMRSQNPDLSRLDSALLKAEGRRALQDGLSLDVACDMADGDDRLFRQALQRAKVQLQKAHATLSTGYDSTDATTLALASEIEELATDLYDEMITKKKKRSRRTNKKK